MVRHLMTGTEPFGENTGKTASGRIDTPRVLLDWTEAPWDTAIFGYPVLQITRIEVRATDAGHDLSAFDEECAALGAGLVSCRLSHDRLRESILLEEHGFRFIEMIFQPEIDFAPNAGIDAGTLLDVEPAGVDELPAVLDIAGSAFRTERFHVDPRLDPALGDLRYCNWVRNSLNHPSQRLYVIRDQSRIVAFFVTEMQGDGTCYWHLTAVAPDAQGQGYGRRAWRTMLQQARNLGARGVRTSIAARNHRVLNLYARLGFRFPPPQMTFHWFRSTP
jgi:ribosomal protein S18 acetylase RimI-like enzyme